MLEPKSPLNGASFAADGISLREAPDFTLTLYAGSAVSLRREVGELPDFGLAEEHGDATYFRAAPDQILVVGEAIATRLCSVTPLSSARVRIEITGPKARNLLSACAAIDFSLEALKPKAFVMTGIHHVPVLIHALPDETFHIYGLRTFAQTLWEWIVDAASSLR